MREVHLGAAMVQWILEVHFVFKTPKQLHSNVQSPANYPSIVVASFVQANTCTSEKDQI